MKEKFKMQQVSFRNVSELLDFLPEDERNLMIRLRSIIHTHIPQAQERLSFQVPYYKINRDICFLWPGSVLWGKNKMYDGVRLGFVHGHLLADDTGYLDRGDRKQVAYHDYISLRSVDEDRMATLLYMAVEVDQHRPKP